MQRLSQRVYKFRTGHSTPVLKLNIKTCIYPSFQHHLPSFRQVSLLCLCKTNSVVAEIVHRVPSTEESIAQNSQRTGWFGEVHTHEGGNARSLHLEDVVVWSNGEVVAAEVEGQVWHAVTLIALNRVLSVVTLLGTDLFVKKLSHGGWEGNEGSAGVQNHTSVFNLSSRCAKGDGIEGDLPVSLAPQWNICDLARVVGLVDATECDLRGVFTLRGVAEIESEDWFVYKTLVDHLVEWRWDSIDTDPVVTETQDAIESAESEGKTWLGGSLGEELVLDRQVTNGDSVLGDVAAKLARAVSDLEGRSVLLVCRRGAVVILLMKVAGNGTAL
jgi:hypothetical protein